MPALLIRGPGIRVPSSAPKKNPRLTVENAVQIVGFSVLQGVRNSQNVPYLYLTLEKMPCRVPYAVPCF